MRRIDIYMFALIIVYFTVSMFNLFVYKFTEHAEYIQMAWIFFLALPIFVPRIRNWMKREPQ